MVPVEHPLSGGIVFRKPQPRDYGFCDESEVQKVISAEEKRRKKIGQISIFSFLAVFFVASAAVLLILGFLISPLSVSGDTMGSLTRLLLVTLSAGTGLVLGTLSSFVAGAFSRRILQPSSEYRKAKQYLDANWMWKRRLQQEYGYESY